MGVLSHQGRWFTDQTGRVVLLHGTNFVQKFPPIAGFGEDDAAYIAQQGYAAVVEGGRVLSEPCAPTLVVANDAGAARVSVRVEPSASCAS